MDVLQFAGSELALHTEITSEVPLAVTLLIMKSESRV